MITEKEFALFESMNITFKLSPTGKYANIYKKDKFVGSIYNTNNVVYFFGKEFFETTGKELIEFLNNNNSNLLADKKLTNDEIFRIWKRCVTENKYANDFDKEFGKGHNYMLNAFKRLHLPATARDRMTFNKNILASLLKQNYYQDAKTILMSISK